MTSTLLSDRAVIRLSPADEGEDVAEFLQGLVTNDVKGALPAWAALLTPQGKVLFDFIVWPGPEGAGAAGWRAGVAASVAGPARHPVGRYSDRAFPGRA